MLTKMLTIQTKTAYKNGHYSVLLSF